MVDESSLESTARAFAAKLREALGGLAGDAASRARDRAGQTSGSARDTLGDAVATAGEWRETVVAFTRDKPIVALAAAAATGFVLRALVQTRPR